MEQEAIDNRTGRSAAIGAGLGLLFTFPALLVAVLSGGAGHGDYLFARALFPLPMLLTFDSTIGLLSLASALIQFPLYGWLAGKGLSKKRFTALWAAMAVHGLAAIACFSGAIPNFS